MSLPLVAIVGAPNVGKSTLFNRLVGQRRAIVTDEPGVTRDRLYAEVREAARPFRLVDTGGLTPHTKAPFAREIEQQAEAALDEAAVVIFVVDSRAGLTATDRDLAAMLRRRGLPLLVVANKIDAESVEPAALELHELGCGDPLSVSAEHGRGIEDLLEAIERLLGEERAADAERDPNSPLLDVAIVGRPNVGKSSILNQLVGQERTIVSDVPGTTRDSIDTILEVGERAYRLIDTAGIRRPGRLEAGAERFSVVHARRNIERCDVAVVVLDAVAGLTAQDAHIAGYVQQAYRPMVVAINKWDLVAEREEEVKLWSERIRERLHFTHQAPLVFVSAKTGLRVAKLLDRIDEVHAAARRRVPTVELNRWLQEMRPGDPAAPPPRDSFRLFYATQIGIKPPRFLLFCNDPRRAHFSLRRQLENSLRERFGFGPTPLRLDFRGRREAKGS